MSALVVACESGDTDVVKQLLTEPSVNGIIRAHEVSCVSARGGGGGGGAPASGGVWFALV